MHPPWKFFAAPALHLHNIRTVIVYTCIIAYVTISMFKIGFSQKVGHFHPESYLTFFRHGSFCFGQFLIWEVLQMTVIRPPWRNDYAIKSRIRKRTHWLRISGLWLCCRQYLSFLYSHHFFFDGNTGGERQRQRILSNWKLTRTISSVYVHPYGGCTVRVRIWQWQFHFAFCMELPELFIRQSHHAVLRIEEKPIRS